MRDERGSAIVSVIGVVLALLLLGGAALSLSQRRLEDSARDRDLVRATAAADAAADVAGLRMNRALVSTGLPDLVGLPRDAVRRVGCISLVSAPDVAVPGASAQLQANLALGETDWCPASATEDLGDGASFSYSVGTQLTVLGGPLVQRRVVAIGRSGRVERRLLVTYELDLEADTPTRLFRRARYVVCTARPSAARPDDGCPDPERTS